jgi:hypothetical protein
VPAAARKRIRAVRSTLPKASSPLAPGQCMGALPRQSDSARARSALVALRVMDNYQPSICDDLDMARGILRPFSYAPTAAPVARILPRICEIRPRLDAWIRHAETQSAL